VFSQLNYGPISLYARHYSTTAVALASKYLAFDLVGRASRV